jgi:hypothetical protein
MTSSKSAPPSATAAMTTTALAFAAALTTLSPGAAHAQVQPPTPYALASQLDFECRPAQGIAPAPQVLIRQLNPVLQNRLPNQMANLGALEQVCVPVAKNGQIPGPRALPIVEMSDLACYRATAAPVDVDVTLSHLNPVLAGLPDEDVHLVSLQQVCVPVSKNDSQLPPAIKQIVSHLDFACYELAEATSSADRTLVLSHLNPVIQAMQLPNRVVDMKRAKQLCVPVAKNNEQVPPGVRDIVEWVDFLKYRIDVAGAVPPLPLWLTHLNPLFAGLDRFPVVLGNDDLRLMVPVAKDGQLPPGQPAAR